MEEIARVYARSLFEVAKEQDKLDVVREQLGQFAEALNDSPDVSTFFFAPYFSTAEKEDGLGKLLDGVDPVVENFLKLMIENHRVPAVFRVRREFDALWDKENELLPVSITSAVELDKKTVKQIGDQITEQTGRKVELSTDVDPDVLGGLVVRVGNTVLDASVRRRLETLRREVAKAA